jgi:hypothetical protein
MPQQPLSLREFQKKCGTEKAGQKHGVRRRWPEGFKGLHGGHPEAESHSTRR